jgi:hypothetical protein
MNWILWLKIGFAIIVSCWVLGAFISAIFTWISSALRDNYFRNTPDCVASSFPDFVFAFFLGLLLWPSLIDDQFQEARFYFAVRFGKLPRWMVYGESESSGRVWDLSDKTEFSTGFNIGMANEDTVLTADYLEGVDEVNTMTRAGNAQYRYRRIAPTVSPNTSEWQDMAIAAPAPEEETIIEMSEDNELEEDDQFIDGPTFKVVLQLERGKYEFEYRVRNKKGVFEEFSKDVVIVVAADEHTPR